jgi:hypothetical protein
LLKSYAINRDGTAGLSQAHYNGKDKIVLRNQVWLSGELPRTFLHSTLTHHPPEVSICGQDESTVGKRIDSGSSGVQNLILRHSATSVRLG